jgi:hypothetical protein
MKMLSILKEIFRAELLKENHRFNDESTGYHHGQQDNTITMYIDNQKVAYADYTIFEGKIQINFIESLVKGKGYGKAIMKYLVDKYGYKNLERYSLTPDGVKMRQSLDKDFNFDYQKHKESQSKHLQPSIIDKIKINHPIAAAFLKDMSKFGHEKTWAKWIDYLRDKDLLDKYDFNSIGDISEWISGSVTNDNNPERDIPEPIINDLNKLTN